jgi:hypothetical protein
VYTLGFLGDETKKQLDKLDMESKQYMKNAEKKCQRTNSGCIPFLLEAEKWIQHLQEYCSLLNFYKVGDATERISAMTIYTYVEKMGDHIL